MSYNKSNTRDSSSSHRNSDKYIPRERDDRRGDDRRPRGDDRRPRDDDRRPRDAYYEAYEGVYGGDVARAMYAESKAPITHPSICIPRTFTTIRGEQTKRAVFNTFRDLRIGHIERIDTVHKTDQKGERYCTVYVHLKWNVTNALARDTRQKLLDGNDIKVVYDEPWFWKCTMSNMDKPDDRNEQRAHTTSRPRIDLGDGVKALSRDPRSDERRTDEAEREHHDERQLCNMDPEDEDN